jgi:hypothetical protein
MTVVERHRTSAPLPDLIVGRDGDDWMIGFDGYAWHTHGDILHAWGYPGSPEQATRAFVDDVVASRRPIVVWRIGGGIRDLDVPVEWEVDLHELQEAVSKYGAAGETVEVCYWKGRETPPEPGHT